jgi:hypothetical protein
MQVVVSSIFTITTGYTFEGIGIWDNKTFAALTAAASNMAGGYNSSFINVTTAKPALGFPMKTFVNSKPAAIDVSHMSSNGRKRLLQQQEDHNDTSSSHLMPQHVWVSYSGIAAQDVKDLLHKLRKTCGRVKAAAGVNLSNTPCGIDTKQVLIAAGVQLSDTYSQSWLEPPVVTLNVHVSIGLTEDQYNNGMDMKVASWLSQPSNIPTALMTTSPTWKIGDPLLQWLHGPDVLVVDVVSSAKNEQNSAVCVYDCPPGTC